MNGVRSASVCITRASGIASALVVKLKTAKALGLTIPPSLLIRAEEVIE